jgi:hypothetical protein
MSPTRHLRLRVLSEAADASIPASRYFPSLRGGRLLLAVLKSFFYVLELPFNFPEIQE